MSQPVSNQNLSNPTISLKTSDSASRCKLSEITSEDFRKYQYTGIKIKIKTPLVKDSRLGLFAINLDGYIPAYSLRNTAATWGNITRNLMPVQPFINAIDSVDILIEPIAPPIMHLYHSARFIQGSVNVGLRITSNTAQSGNLIVAQATGVVREFYGADEPYTGLRFQNSSNSPSDYQMDNFALGDVSLNRHLSITTGRNDTNQVTDIAKKIDTIGNFATYPNTDTGVRKITPFQSQFAEDWLLVSILSDLPNQNANIISIDVFFDYSGIQFLQFIYPIVPAVPFNFDNQIYDFSKTFNAKRAIDKGGIDWITKAPRSLANSKQDLKEKDDKSQI